MPVFCGASEILLGRRETPLRFFSCKGAFSLFLASSVTAWAKSLRKTLGGAVHVSSTTTTFTAGCAYVLLATVKKPRWELDPEPLHWSKDGNTTLDDLRAQARGSPDFKEKTTVSFIDLKRRLKERFQPELERFQEIGTDPAYTPPVPGQKVKENRASFELLIARELQSYREEDLAVDAYLGKHEEKTGTIKIVSRNLASSLLEGYACRKNRAEILQYWAEQPCTCPGADGCLQKPSVLQVVKNARLRRARENFRGPVFEGKHFQGCF